MNKANNYGAPFLHSHVGKKSGFLQEHLLPRMCLLENKIHGHRSQNG